MNIFEQGYLSNFAGRIFNASKVLDKEKLTANNLARIATILGHLSKEHDLYNLLFEQEPQMLMVDGTEVNTRDLATMVLLDHSRTRGYFHKVKDSDTSYCQGVPLALEGAKRVNNKQYSSWLDGLDMDDNNSLIRCDMFLPAHLNSYNINEAGGVEPSKKHGLITFLKNNVVFPDETIKQIRAQVLNWKGKHNPGVIDPSQVDGKYGIYYNNCAQKMRCLLIQSWVFQLQRRNDTMITSITDWDTPSANTEGMFDNMLPDTAVTFTFPKRAL